MRRIPMTRRKKTRRVSRRWQRWRPRRTRPAAASLAEPARTSTQGRPPVSLLPVSSAKRRASPLTVLFPWQRHGRSPLWQPPWPSVWPHRPPRLPPGSSPPGEAAAEDEGKDEDEGDDADEEDSEMRQAASCVRRRPASSWLRSAAAGVSRHLAGPKTLLLRCTWYLKYSHDMNVARCCCCTAGAHRWWWLPPGTGNGSKVLMATRANALGHRRSGGTTRAPESGGVVLSSGRPRSSQMLRTCFRECGGR